MSCVLCLLGVLTGLQIACEPEIGLKAYHCMLCKLEHFARECCAKGTKRSTVRTSETKTFVKEPHVTRPTNPASCAFQAPTAKHSYATKI